MVVVESEGRVVTKSTAQRSRMYGNNPVVRSWKWISKTLWATLSFFATWTKPIRSINECYCLQPGTKGGRSYNCMLTVSARETLACISFYLYNCIQAEQSSHQKGPCISFFLCDCRLAKQSLCQKGWGMVPRRQVLIPQNQRTVLFSLVSMDGLTQTIQDTRSGCFFYMCTTSSIKSHGLYSVFACFLLIFTRVGNRDYSQPTCGCKGHGVVHSPLPLLHLSVVVVELYSCKGTCASFLHG